MIIQCDSCRTRFRLDDSKIKPNGVRVRCTKCQNVFVVSPPPSADEVEVEDVFGVPSRPGADAGGPSGGPGQAESGAAGPPQGAEPGGAGFEGLDFSFGVDRSASGEEDAAPGSPPEPSPESSPEPSPGPSPGSSDEDLGGEGPAGAGREEGAEEELGADSAPGQGDMPDFGAGMDNYAFEGPGEGDLGVEDGEAGEGLDESLSSAAPFPDGDDEVAGGRADEGGESEAAAPSPFDEFEPPQPGHPADAGDEGLDDEGPSGVDDDEADWQPSLEDRPFEGAGEEQDLEQAGGEAAEAAAVPGAEGGGEGGAGGPFDDFDLSFSDEGGEEDLSDVGGEGEAGAGEEDWDLGSVGSEEAEPPGEPDEPVEGCGEAEGGSVEPGAEDDGTVSAGYGGAEQGEDYHGFEAVYQEEESATGGAGGDGPDLDYDPAKKVIPFSPGAKKGDERPSAGPAREFSEVFNHVISREEVFNSSLALDDEEGDEGEFLTDDEDFDSPTAGPARPSRLRLGLLIAGLIIVLGGGGLYASGVIDTLTRAIVSSGPTTSDILGIERLNGYVVENGRFGALFAIEAVVKNKTDEPQEIKSIRGVLTGRRGTLVERSVSPGRVLSSDDLKNLPKAAIEKHFSDPSGGTIPPRGIIPVMVVFTDIPSGVGEFGIDIVR